MDKDANENSDINIPRIIEPVFDPVDPAQPQQPTPGVVYAPVFMQQPGVVLVRPVVSGLATAAIITVWFLPFVGFILAIFALVDISRRKVAGSGRAITALVVGGLETALVLPLIFAAIGSIFIHK